MKGAVLQPTAGREELLLRPHSTTEKTPLRGPAEAIAEDLSARDEPPRMVVVIDVEEEFDWSAPFSLRNRKVTGNGNLHLVQDVCDRLGVQPTYLIDYAAASSPELTSAVKRWLAEGRCQIGAQLHTWITPPHEEVICVQNSYECNLTRDLEARKMKCLTERIEETTGTRPTIFKAGRYGISRRTVELLVELGYKIDTSVVPFTNYEGLGGGPDFSHMPHRPFWLDRQSRLLEVPLSRAVVGPLARHLGRFASRLIDNRVGGFMHLPGIVSRLLGLERLTLSPEGSELGEMKRLLAFELDAGCRIFTLSLHSSSLVVGGSPYASDARDVARLLENTADVLQCFKTDHGGKVVSMLELHREMSERVNERREAGALGAAKASS